MDLYDEFGNYIGPDLDEDDEVDDHSELGDLEDEEEGQNHFDARGREGALVHVNGEEGMEVDDDHNGQENRIILHEDKKYYPEAQEVYPGVKTITLDEDAQDLQEPIIKPIKPKTFSLLTKEIPTLKYDADYLTGLSQSPTLLRHIALFGHLHHGKTSFADLLIESTHEKEWDIRYSSSTSSSSSSATLRYLDSRKDEQERQISIKSTPITLLLEDLRDKSWVINLIDTPGHSNFSDEATAAMRAVDGAVIIVDAVEGVLLQTTRLLEEAVLNEVDICLVITKVDRLILELKLPPQDAYYKLQHTIEECNRILYEAGQRLADHQVNPKAKSSPTYHIDRIPHLSPAKGNVCFASGLHQWCFSLESFASHYLQRRAATAGTTTSSEVSVQQLASRLWGDWYLHTPSNRMTKRSGGGKGLDDQYVRTFIHFILNPLYKIYSYCIGESPQMIQSLFRDLGIKMVTKEYHSDPRVLVTVACKRFFGLPRAFVTMVANHVASPCVANQRVLDLFYSGGRASSLYQSMSRCDSEGPLVAHVTKLYSNPEGNAFDALARIYSGKLSLGEAVRVLGEGYSANDDEDMGVAEVTAIALPMGRWQMEISHATAGMIVLLRGIDRVIKKTATLLSADYNYDQENNVGTFLPLIHRNRSIIKVAIEPFRPPELPKMIEGLRRLTQSYPLIQTKVEESGEHVLLGTGELYLDCALHDLRTLHSDIEIKVADPVASLQETVTDTSLMNILVETANKRNTFSLVAEPLEDAVIADIDARHVNLTQYNNKDVAAYFKSHYGYDPLTAHNLWAFGPGDQDPCLLVNNTLPMQTDAKQLGQIRESVIQGFKWGSREGPLCDEPMRGVKVRLLDVSLSNEAIHRGGGQVIPAIRRGVYSSFLLASPRLLEPVYLAEITAPADCVQAVYPVLSRRRGHIVKDAPKPGAPFYTIQAYLPAMDSFGFETDLRSYTLGQVFCQTVFDHWAVVPGDPLDRSVVLHPLEPSPPLALARDFMVKTRRRKGLAEDVVVQKYLDDSMLLRLAKYEEEHGGSAGQLVMH